MECSPDAVNELHADLVRKQDSADVFDKQPKRSEPIEPAPTIPILKIGPPCRLQM